MKAETNEVLTIGQAADEVGMQLWRLDRLVTRGLIPTPMRVGHTRCFTRGQLGLIREAAEKAGYVTLASRGLASA